MQVTIQSINGPTATVSAGVEYDVDVSVSRTVTATASVVGIQGVSGAGVDVGNGLQIVGSEIRYDIQSLARA